MLLRLHPHSHTHAALGFPLQSTMPCNTQSIDFRTYNDVVSIDRLKAANPSCEVLNSQVAASHSTSPQHNRSTSATSPPLPFPEQSYPNHTHHKPDAPPHRCTNPYILFNILLMRLMSLHIHNLDYKPEGLRLNPQNIFVISSKQANKTMALRSFFCIYLCFNFIAVFRAVMYHQRLNVLRKGPTYEGHRALFFLKSNRGMLCSSHCYVTTKPVYNRVAATFCSFC